MEALVEVFRDCAVRVLRQMGGLEPKIGPLARVTESRTRDSLSAVVGLQGDLAGSMALVMSREVVWQVAGRVRGALLGEDEVEAVHAIVMEVANTIAGNATGLLLKRGLREGLTPPTLVEGPQVFFGFVGGIETFAAPLLTEEGACALIVSLQASPGRPQA